MSSLDPILRPRSIAVIGASRKKESIGWQIMDNLLSHGFDGPIYPINPHADAIHSVPAYPSIGDVRADVDLAVVVFNDARLSLIDIKREQRQMQDLGLSWDAPDFARIADGFGFTVWTAETREEMRSAASAAAAGSGPRLIDARVDASGYLQQLRALRG